MGCRRGAQTRVLIVCSQLTVCLQPRDGNLFVWDVALVVLNPTSLYHGAYLKASYPFLLCSRAPSSCSRTLFSTSQTLVWLTLQTQAELKMPKNYPMSPPEFRFTRPLFHPNIYKDGRLCISILHSPGEDEMSGELASVCPLRSEPAGRMLGLTWCTGTLVTRPAHFHRLDFDPFSAGRRRGLLRGQRRRLRHAPQGP